MTSDGSNDHADLTDFLHLSVNLFSIVAMRCSLLLPPAGQHTLLRNRPNDLTLKGWLVGYLNLHLLTPWCRVLLEKLTGLQLVKKFPAFHGPRRFITALTSVPVTTAWRVLRLRIEERPPIRSVAANKLNKQSRTADGGGPPAWGLGEVLTNPPCKKTLLRNTHVRDN